MALEQYDVALSFAEEDRSVALCIYLAIKMLRPELKVYYYPKEGGRSSGEDLQEILPKIYRDHSKSVIMLVSKDYINPDKGYVPSEIKALVKRHKERESGKPFLIPLRVDGTILEEVDPYFTDSIGWHEWKYDPESVVEVVAQMLGLKPKKTEKAINKYFHKTTTINKIKTKNMKGNQIIQGSNNKIS